MKEIISAMTFEQFKNKTLKLAKKNKVLHLCPGSNDLYRLWEQKITPQKVVEVYCNVEASKLRNS